MLIDMMTGKAIAQVPFEQEYKQFMARLAPNEIVDILTLLNEKIDGDEIHTSGWMPGSDWRGTPFQPIYEKAARMNPDLAARCFGLMVWDVFMRRPEVWTSGRFEKNGEPIGSRTYFKPKSQ